MWNCSSYGNDLDITKEQALKGSHTGACDDDIEELMLEPSIKQQLDTLDPDSLKIELKVMVPGTKKNYKTMKKT